MEHPTSRDILVHLHDLRIATYERPDDCVRIFNEGSDDKIRVESFAAYYCKFDRQTGTSVRGDTRGRVACMNPNGPEVVEFDMIDSDGEKVILNDVVAQTLDVFSETVNCVVLNVNEDLRMMGMSKYEEIVSALDYAIDTLEMSDIRCDVVFREDVPDGLVEHISRSVASITVSNPPKNPGLRILISENCQKKNRTELNYMIDLSALSDSQETNSAMCIALVESVRLGIYDGITITSSTRRTDGSAVVFERLLNGVERLNVDQCLTNLTRMTARELDLLDRIPKSVSHEIDLRSELCVPYLFSIYVDPDGFIFPCRRASTVDARRRESVFERGDEIWHSVNTKRFRLELLMVRSDGDCGFCPFGLSAIPDIEDLRGNPLKRSRKK